MIKKTYKAGIFVLFCLAPMVAQGGRKEANEALRQACRTQENITEYQLKLWLEDGAELHPANEEEHPLVIALKSGNYGMVKLLEANGAKPSRLFFETFEEKRDAREGMRALGIKISKEDGQWSWTQFYPRNDDGPWEDWDYTNEDFDLENYDEYGPNFDSDD